ncbi:hypothetical protein MmiHf6_16350 [Methanimicrococcus hongohii]|uniref:DUF5666 domain-containing protein n=1 Tax=Methanimicrococcus hongohii TaxID=3028295 RepID=A0AA96ZT94_9EURY|nr:hypothetical protein [Methanimicrococcus sp. Hf6]WNY24304.1 hypothetical protein MmiHf6_16350 [Methanimicrococcus sp. Hf6]
MKKQLFFIGLCLVLGAVLVAGCLGGDKDNNSTNNSTNGTNNTTFLPPDPIAAPADTAMYRGNVINVTNQRNETSMTLSQVKGTNFGTANMKFIFDNNSKMNFNLSDLKEGQYVEVYYAPPADGPREETTAIVANLLQYANMTVYNGEIVSVTPEVNVNNTTYVGKIEVKLENNSTMIFNCDRDTQFYMNMSNVTAGTKINVYGNWVIQTSSPPQTMAYEVREYA